MSTWSLWRDYSQLPRWPTDRSMRPRGYPQRHCRTLTNQAAARCGLASIIPDQWTCWKDYYACHAPPTNLLIHLSCILHLLCCSHLPCRFYSLYHAIPNYHAILLLICGLYLLILSLITTTMQSPPTSTMRSPRLFKLIIICAMHLFSRFLS